MIRYGALDCGTLRAAVCTPSGNLRILTDTEVDQPIRLRNLGRRGDRFSDLLVSSHEPPFARILVRSTTEAG